MAQPNTGVDRARDALSAGAWADAYDAFSTADRALLTPSDLEGLADAAWWISRFEDSLDARQKAYAAHAAAGDEIAAGAVAARLAIEHFIRGEPSVGGGFLMRAQRHLQDQPPCPEQGFLVLIQANAARFSGALEQARSAAQEATRIGETFGDRDLVAMAIHTEGLVLIDGGEVAAGLALMDEAMTAVLAGDLSPYFTGVIYCNLIQACLEVNDLRRAGEWSDAARSWCDALQPGSPYPGMCRVNRAEVARLRGAWPEAEAEAVLASEELADTDPGLAASAFVQVGEVRRRMGDVDGAEAAFARARELGVDPQPGLALLRLAQGRTEAARTALRLALAGEGQRPRRARLLAAQVEVAIAAGALDEAQAAVEELETTARETGTASFDAIAGTAAGARHLAGGDVSAALERLRAACAVWQQLKLPYEAARTRVSYGLAIRAGGDPDGAALELRGALAAFEHLGAVPDAAAVALLLGTPAPVPGGLTPREAEVLRLLAGGRTNRDIAVELVISEHTVGRHLQNIYAKIGVSSRSAATAFAFANGLS